jgi:hypothetical protein
MTAGNLHLKKETEQRVRGKDYAIAILLIDSATAI